MAYRYRSRRSARRLAHKSKRNFVITLLLIGVLIYVTIQWILPNLIGGLGFIQNIVKPPKKVVTSDSPSLAPPVLNIPYEATNTSKINIKGYGTPNSKVKLYLDDEGKQTVDVSSDGSFVFEKVSLNLGTNNIFGKTVEGDHESLSSKLIKLIYDNEKPSLNINEPEDGKKIQGGDKKVKISGKTEGGVQVFINDNQVIVDKDGNFSSEQSLNDGDNIFSIKAYDLAANATEIQRRVTYTP